ncbi:uncharacterized protein [Castor canadensis]|uniref:Uncharacterized protein n=1 Tax=Castor canadensis TaxID=51338 RepID=A0AC58NH51_CASCN
MGRGGQAVGLAAGSGGQACGASGCQGQRAAWSGGRCVRLRAWGGGGQAVGLAAGSGGQAGSGRYVGLRVAGVRFTVRQVVSSGVRRAVHRAGVEGGGEVQACSASGGWDEAGGGRTAGGVGQAGGAAGGWDEACGASGCRRGQACGASGGRGQAGGAADGGDQACENLQIIFCGMDSSEDLRNQSGHLKPELSFLSMLSAFSARNSFRKTRTTKL